MNNSLIKKTQTFLIDSSFTPVEIFALEHCLKETEGIKFKLLKEEELADKKSLILWGDNLNIVQNKEVINIKDINKIKLKQSGYIIYGISDSIEEYKKMLSDTFKIEILEYENSETILFERAI